MNEQQGLEPATESRSGALWIALLFLVSAAVLAWYAVRVHTFQPDELIYVSQARELASDFPSALWDTTVFDLGVERINPILGALTVALFSTAGALTAHKVLIALVFASVVFPAYLLGRGIGLARLWALLAAALSVAIPWVVLATSFLNDPIAYTAFAWAVFGAWYAAMHLGWRGDLVGLGLVALAPLARTNLAIMGVPLVIGIVAAEARYHRPWTSMRAALDASRRHVPVAAVVLLAVAYVAVRGVSSASGVYTVDLTPPVDLLFEKSAEFLSYLADGLAIIPLGIAFAWALRHAIRPLDRERHVLAVVGLASAAALLYSLNGGVLQERYIMYLACPVAVMAVAAVARRDVPWALAGVGLAAAALVHVAGDRIALEGIEQATAEQLSGPYATFAYPGQSWWDNVVEGQAAVRLPDPLGSHPGTVMLILLVLLPLGGMALLRAGGRAGTVGAGVMAAALFGLGVSSSVWALDKFVDRAGDTDGPTFEQRAWLDRTLPEGEVPLFLAQPTPWIGGARNEVAFYNERFDNERSANEPLEPRMLARRLQPGGALQMELPRYLLVSTDLFQSVGVAGRRLAQAPYLPVALIAPDRPARATWRAQGPTNDGWLGARDRATIRTWDRCVEFSVTSAPDQPSNVTIRLPGSRTDERRLQSAQTVRVRTERPGLTGLEASGKGTVPPDRFVSARLTDLMSVPCR